MSAQLAIRIRKSRELRIELDKPRGDGKFTVVALRPSDLEMSELIALAGHRHIRRMLECVVDWEGVIEDDLIGGGGTDSVTFNARLWAEWAADNGTWWNPIAERLKAAYATHIESLEAAAKN